MFSLTPISHYMVSSTAVSLDDISDELPTTKYCSADTEEHDTTE